MIRGRRLNNFAIQETAYGGVKRVKRGLTNLNIQKKLLFWALGITLLVLLAASLSFYLAASNMMVKQSEKQSAGVVHELSLNLDHYFELVENSFDYISNDNQVQEELHSDTPYHSDGSEPYTYYSRAGRIRRLLLQGYTSVYMNGIQLYGYNGANHILSGEQGIVISDEKEVIQRAEEANGRCIYFSDAESTGLIYMAKQIKDSLTTEPLGILLATIKVSYLEKMTRSARNSLDAELFLLDNTNEVILNSTQEDIDSFLNQLIGPGGSFLYEMKGQRYSCVYQSGSDTGFVLGCMVPLQFFKRTVKDLQKIMLILGLLSVTVCIVLTSLLAKGIAGPIERTSSAMKQFAGGDFTVRLPEDRTDEIGEMNVVFNHTIEEIESLLKKVVEVETVSKDIEFQALQAQINPHFLYNVLDTINWMARKKGEDNICKMVTAVSNLMRASISNRKSMVTIKEEMNYVRDYLYIQETRYGDKLASILEVDEALNELIIPKMTVQTLVENAVVHGVENSLHDCFLYISGECEGLYAVLKVKDNGVGMTQERLQQILEPESREKDGEEDRKHTRLGVYAVRKRLEYVYGGDIEFQILSKEGEGTEVTVKLPMNQDRRVSLDGITGNDSGR